MRWVNIKPGRRSGLLLGALPLLAVLVVYLFAAAARHAANPSDKILPTPSAMVAAMRGLLVDADPLTGHLIFWADTLASLQRLGLALGICTLSALLVGLLLGVLPAARATLGGLVTTVAVIPPIALLPV